MKYGINPYLLVAIAKTESGLNPNAVNRSNRDGSRDVGLMQINSAWFPLLARHGISERDLYDPCTAIDVGAWILAQNMRRLGSSWDAVGAYNAGDASRRLAYARKVYRNLPDALRLDEAPCSPAPGTTVRGRKQTPPAQTASCD